jgi:predicted NACHT family NTPase
LARNPVMLSAICLVNYFEARELPKDRALLYRLCVEGLLHHWDQCRGIHSDFTLEEKLRTCREGALRMQAGDRAEYEAEKVKDIFTAVLGDDDSAAKLLEHIRYHTGLLLERRPGGFAFAHLTFQEYLAARAIHEGNRHGIDTERLIWDHNDGRWQEVIALYCGQAPTPAARRVIELPVSQPNTSTLSTVLAEAYLSAGPELSQDKAFRRRVLERSAIAATPQGPEPRLMRFPPDEVAPIAHRLRGHLP